MRLNRKHLTKIRKEKGYFGKPGSKLNKELTQRMLREQLRKKRLQEIKGTAS